MLFPPVDVICGRWGIIHEDRATFLADPIVCQGVSCFGGGRRLFSGHGGGDYRVLPTLFSRLTWKQFPAKETEWNFDRKWWPVSNEPFPVSRDFEEFSDIKLFFLSVKILHIFKIF